MAQGQQLEINFDDLTSANSHSSQVSLVIRVSEDHPYSSWHFLVQIQRWKQQNNVWNLFKVNQKDTSGIVNFEQIFTHCSGISIVDFEQENAGWNREYSVNTNS